MSSTPAITHIHIMSSTLAITNNTNRVAPSLLFASTATVKQNAEITPLGYDCYINCVEIHGSVVVLRKFHLRLIHIENSHYVLQKRHTQNIRAIRSVFDSSLAQAGLRIL